MKEAVRSIKYKLTFDILTFDVKIINHSHMASVKRRSHTCCSIIIQCQSSLVSSQPVMLVLVLVLVLDDAVLVLVLAAEVLVLVLILEQKSLVMSL